MKPEEQVERLWQPSTDPQRISCESFVFSTTALISNPELSLFDYRVPVAWNTMAAVSKESKPNKSIPSTSRI
jgi:hypothetical protein